MLLGAVGFIGLRLAALKPEELLAQATWPLFAAMGAAALSFAVSDALFARGWSELALTDGVISRRRAQLIYGRGVLMKYLPGSVFQYVSRQIEGRQAGLSHSVLARASIDEAILHVAASLCIAALWLLAETQPVVAALAGSVVAGGLLLSRTTRFRALGSQLIAFFAFSLGALLAAIALFPGLNGQFAFAGMFLLAWLAGFLVPVAPGGLGVREAVLLALAGSTVPAPELLMAALALRLASIGGDLAFGAFAFWRAD